LENIQQFAHKVVEDINISVRSSLIDYQKYSKFTLKMLQMLSNAVGSRFNNPSKYTILERWVIVNYSPGNILKSMKSDLVKFIRHEFYVYYLHSY